MPGLRKGHAPGGPLKPEGFLVECQTCRQSFVVDVPVGFYVPSRCAMCRGGPGLTPTKADDHDSTERRRYRFRE